MALTVYTLEQTDAWDAIVRSFSAYDVYWCSGYIKAFFQNGDGEPLLFHYEDKAVRGISVVMKRDVAADRHFAGKIEEGKYFDFATPYGYGGWLIEGTRTEGLFAAYQAWAERNGVVSEFVRFHPMLENHTAVKDFFSVVQLGEVVHMDLTSPETIWNNITSKNRNMIRKAIKNGVQIYNGRFPQLFETFREIYNETMQRDNADSYYFFPPAFYTSILEDLPENAQIFWAEKDGRIIAVSIILAANGRMNYHLSGSLAAFGSFAPTNLLLYKAALWGCANNMKTLYLGGGVGSGEDSLFKFKRAFYKGELHRFCIGKKIYDPDAYNKLLAMRAEIENPGFFPKYRG